MNLEEMEKFINELREEQKSLFEKSKHQSLEVTELKEILNEVAQAQIGEIEQIKEVLRELIIVFNDNYFYNKEWYEQLLAKLDVGSARRTGEMTLEECVQYEKDHPDEFDIKTEKKGSCKIESEMSYNEYIASGGENSGEAETRMESSDNFKGSTQTDSKPPEPIDWKKYFPETEKFIHYYKEPREDDVINIREMVKTLTNKEWVLVKREKIEFWRKELLNKTDEVLKSMREVLGSD